VGCRERARSIFDGLANPPGGRHQSDVAGRGVLGGAQHMLSEPVPCLPGGSSTPLGLVEGVDCHDTLYMV
jgi:hypothetical protein